MSLAVLAMLGTGAAHAVQVCDLDGQSINVANGSTTAGKTGLVRCRDGEGGPIVREQGLRNGVFMGVVRYFRNGALEREYNVNERGNRDGLAREFEAAGVGKPVIVREETFQNGTTIGLARTWYPSGTLRRVGFHDGGRETAVAEFNAQGQLSELQCGARALLGSDADDASWCGHKGAVPSTVVLYDGKGRPKARLAFERGERRKSETLWESGAVREQREWSGEGGSERSFSADGVERHEVRWQYLAAGGSGGLPGRVTTLDQEFHESGKLVRERRWRVGGPGSERGGEPVSDKRWYLNGQPRETIEYELDGSRTLRRETAFHDNGRHSFEGSWLVAAGGHGGDMAIGVHRSFDDAGRLRSERFHDERGRVNRERELDERGSVVRDDEVFEDGSRKGVGR